MRTERSEWVISIHSLRVEGDELKNKKESENNDFNPLPPCGGRQADRIQSRQSGDFNPLPPCGGRRKEMRHEAGVDYFNPLPPCGGRRTSADFVSKWFHISIHSLRVEGDAEIFATPAAMQISIHSLRVEGD